MAKKTSDYIESASRVVENMLIDLSALGIILISAVVLLMQLRGIIVSGVAVQGYLIVGLIATTLLCCVYSALVFASKKTGADIIYRRRRLWDFFWLLLLFAMSPYFYHDIKAIGEPFFMMLYLCALVAAPASSKKLPIYASSVSALYLLIFAIAGNASGVFISKVATLCASGFILSYFLKKGYIAMLKHLEAESDTDGLTRLLNRRAGHVRMQGMFDMCKRIGRMCAVYWIDFDYFKEYNALYGHAQGDVALFNIAKCIGGTFSRATDVVARMGGEEFAAMALVPDEETALHLAAKLSRDIRALAIPAAKQIVSPVVTVSIGVALYTPGENAGADSESTLSALLSEADLQMYVAKNESRNAISLKNVLRPNE